MRLIVQIIFIVLEVARLVSSTLWCAWTLMCGKSERWRRRPINFRKACFQWLYRLPWVEWHAPEISTQATALLKSLCKHLVSSDVVIANGPAGKLHGLLEVVLTNIWNWIAVIHFLHEQMRHKHEKLRNYIQAERGGGNVPCLNQGFEPVPSLVWFLALWTLWWPICTHAGIFPSSRHHWIHGSP